MNTQPQLPIYSVFDADPRFIESTTQAVLCWGARTQIHSYIVILWYLMMFIGIALKLLSGCIFQGMLPKKLLKNKKIHPYPSTRGRLPQNSLSVLNTLHLLKSCLRWSIIIYTPLVRRSEVLNYLPPTRLKPSPVDQSAQPETLVDRNAYHFVRRDLPSLLGVVTR